jgi:ATP-binding cassette subfamily B protein
LVGENGAGKSTIISLLLRFYDPTSGRIALDGQDLKTIAPEALRSRFGVMFQDFARYQLTLRENVWLGRADSNAEDTQILSALHAARATPLMSALKRGLNTRLGRLFEESQDVSGGEWQRLALARLIFRSAEIWILDEPTSNVDPEAEAAIFRELKRQLAGRMGIVVSHRFSTVRMADRIYVIDEGRVVESGTHDELIERRGRYASLFELQAAGYR